MTLRASLTLNAVLAAAFITALVALFVVRSAADQATADASNWKHVAAQGSAAYVASHDGKVPKGTRVLSDNGALFVVGFTNSNGEE